MLYCISACLAGENCKYNGGNNSNEEVLKICASENYILICPETMGGLKSPRPPAEITGGTGEDVLNFKAKVMSKTGDDWTLPFIDGAYVTLEQVIDAAEENEEITAIFKARSPSCGCGYIYDGSFGGNLIEGDGVTAALFRRKGIKLYTELDLPKK